MITLNVDMLMRAREAVKKKRADVLKMATAQYRSQALAMYREVLLVAPQFSGDFVSNFDLETTNSPERGYTPLPNKGSVAVSQQPREAGDTDGPFQAAYMRGVARLRYIQYGDPIYIVNPTPIQIDSPEVIGPDGDRKDLRDPAVITAWESISSYLQAKYGDTA